jgi:hypothetical protein
LFVDFPGQSRSGGVVDRAAPVLKKAELHPGKAKPDGTISKDTLYVDFSEPMNPTLSSDKTPYKFFKTRTGGIEYQAQLISPAIRNQLSYSYLVDTIIGPYPASGDSVQIDGDTPIVSDVKSNFQKALSNLKVKLDVIAPNVDTLMVQVGPNPFRPTDGQKVTVMIDPLVKVAESVHLVMKFGIYDQLGNLLYQKEGESDNNSTKFKFEWNGKNLNGRTVGMGSYMLVISGVNSVNGKKLPTTRKMIGIIR